MNVSLNLASRRFYTGVVDPLEYYMDLSLLSPSTRLFQLSQLPSLKDLRRALKNKDLDFIGLNCYYPLSKGEAPSKSELKKNFASVLKKAEKVSKQYNKPLVFTEVGFRSVEDTWKNPHAEADGRPYNPECQRICYEVLFEGIADKDWINGLFIWKWPSYLNYQERNPVSFTPSGKPAEQVVQLWYKEKMGR